MFSCQWELLLKASFKALVVLIHISLEDFFFTLVSGLMVFSGYLNTDVLVDLCFLLLFQRFLEVEPQTVTLLSMTQSSF